MSAQGPTVFDTVIIKHNNVDLRGTLRFVGALKKNGDIFYGVELDEFKGDNEGSLNKVTYFKCENKKGVFVPGEKIISYKLNNCYKAINEYIAVPNQNCLGKIRFIGETNPLDGERNIYYGVDVSDQKINENYIEITNGTLSDHYYFDCSNTGGIFLPSEVCIRKNFYCPLTEEIMLEPMMVVQTGKVYDREAIIKWYEGGNKCDPETKELIPNLVLYNVVDINNSIGKHIDAKVLENICKERKKEGYWDKIFEKMKTRTNAIQEPDCCQTFSPYETMQIKQLIYIKDDIHLELTKSIFLNIDIPIITFMGSSRIGKSSLLNDLLFDCKQQTFKTSPNLAEGCTKGAWLGYYENKKTNQKLYIVDTEGLSTDVTEATKRLFCICYALSDVIVWNDKAIFDHNFFTKMKMLKSNFYDYIQKNDKKPALLYLRRDAYSVGDDLDFPNDYGGHENLKDLLLKKKCPSYKEFIDSKLFQEYDGFELPIRPKKKDNKGFDKNILNKLFDKLQCLIKSENVQRIIKTNIDILTDKIVKQINSNTRLDDYIHPDLYDLPLSKRLLYSISHQNIEKLNIMVCIACDYDWSINNLHAQYNKEKKKLEELKSHDPNIVNHINSNYDEVKGKIEEGVKNHKYYETKIWAQATAASVLTTYTIGIGCVSAAASAASSAAFASFVATTSTQIGLVTFTLGQGINSAALVQGVGGAAAFETFWAAPAVTYYSLAVAALPYAAIGAIGVGICGGLWYLSTRNVHWIERKYFIKYILNNQKKMK